MDARANRAGGKGRRPRKLRLASLLCAVVLALGVIACSRNAGGESSDRLRLEASQRSTYY